MRGIADGAALRVKDVRTGYLFHGEELFPAGQFIEQLKTLLTSPEGEPAAIERHSLGGAGWRDIVDGARNVPFIFSPWRLIIVEAARAAQADLEPDEDAVLREFFASPAPRTVLIVLYAGKLSKASALSRLFEALPESAVEVEELKPLREDKLVEWTDRKTAGLHKRISSEAIDRLIEIVGSDLRLLDSELEKLAAYVGDKTLIELSDVHAVSDWVKSFEEYELTGALERGDIGRAVVILNRLMAEGGRAEVLIGYLAGFFRDLFQARLALDRGLDKREIFREIRPKIKEYYGFYRERFRDFFAAAEGLSKADLIRFIVELERVDVKLKTTDSDPQALLEAFFYEYGRALGRPDVTSKRRV